MNFKAQNRSIPPEPNIGNIAAGSPEKPHDGTRLAYHRFGHLLHPEDKFFSAPVSDDIAMKYGSTQDVKRK